MPSSRRSLGKYALVRRLGGGGMGEVHLATLEGAAGFRREVAIKVIQPGVAATPRFIELFLREGRVLASLNHRGIVNVFELDLDDGRPYLVMEYLRGIDLKLWLKRAGGRLPWLAAAYVCAEVARALAAAHELRHPEAPQGIAHGDLSPSNVMLCVDGAVKLFDFGLARAAGVETSTSGVEGKLPYLAPELHVGVPHDASTDLYSLGVMTYECLTGKRPFKGRNDLETLNLVLHGEVRPPREHEPFVPRALSDLVMQALSRDRSLRPSSARRMAEAVEEVLDGRFGAADLATTLSAAGIPAAAEEPEGDDLATVADGPRAHRVRGSDDVEQAKVSKSTPRRRRWVVLAASAGTLFLVGGAGIVWTTRSRPALDGRPTRSVAAVASERAEADAAPRPERAEARGAADGGEAPRSPRARPKVGKPRRAKRPSATTKAKEPSGEGIGPGFLADPFRRRR